MNINSSWLAGIVIAMLFATAVRAADKPDFTGEWRINVAKSEFGPYPVPTSHTRKVSHAEPSLTVTDEVVGGFGEPRSTRTYTTDGRPISFESLNAKISSAASWTGSGLVFNATGIVDSPAGEMTFTYRENWTLGDEGKTLVQTIHVSSPQGEFGLRYVFDRDILK